MWGGLPVNIFWGVQIFLVGVQKKIFFWGGGGVGLRNFRGGLFNKFSVRGLRNFRGGVEKLLGEGVKKFSGGFEKFLAGVKKFSGRGGGVENFQVGGGG